MVKGELLTKSYKNDTNHVAGAHDLMDLNEKALAEGILDALRVSATSGNQQKNFIAADEILESNGVIKQGAVVLAHDLLLARRMWQKETFSFAPMP